MNNLPEDAERELARSFERYHYRMEQLYKDFVFDMALKFNVEENIIEEAFHSIRLTRGNQRGML